MTIAATCSLPARPEPVTAALTSLGVCRATGTPARAAASTATPAACAVPMTVRTLCWLNTRSTATTSGRSCSIQPSTASPMPSSRAATSALAGVRTTSTATSSARRPGRPSTAARPHRVSPGSTASTRTSSSSGRSCQHHRRSTASTGPGRAGDERQPAAPALPLPPLAAGTAPPRAAPALRSAPGFARPDAGALTRSGGVYALSRRFSASKPTAERVKTAGASQVPTPQERAGRRNADAAGTHAAEGRRPGTGGAPRRSGARRQPTASMTSSLTSKLA